MSAMLNQLIEVLARSKSPIDLSRKSPLRRLQRAISSGDKVDANAQFSQVRKLLRDTGNLDQETDTLMSCILDDINKL